MPPDKFRVALVQMSCGPEPRTKSAKSSRTRLRRRRTRRPGSLPPRTLPDAILLPARRPLPLRPSRTDPRPHQRKASRRRPPAPCSADRVAIRKARPRHLSQHRRHLRFQRFAQRPLPQDAHPRRPALLRKVLLHSRRSGIPRPRHQRRAPRHASLLGSMVPRRRAPNRAARRANSFLSHSHRLASRRESRVRRSPARRLAHHPARPRHRQRSLRSGSQSRRLRNRQHPRQVRPRPGTGILGRIASSAIPSAESSPKPPTTAKKS